MLHINVLFLLIRYGRIVVGDINPDFLEVLFRLWRQFVALRLRLRFFFRFFFNALISAWTWSAGWGDRRRRHLTPSRTSAFQTLSRCFRRRCLHERLCWRFRSLQSPLFDGQIPPQPFVLRELGSQPSVIVHVECCWQTCTRVCYNQTLPYAERS
jgi:hypothetical protein